MIFDTYDYEFMRILGLSRYLPVGLAGRYDAPYFSRGVICSLREMGLVKTQSDRMSYKLTYEGRQCLAEMGYNFPDDARMDLKRPAYKRKLKNGQWNITVSLAGIDVYARKTRELAGKETGYISSLILRADANIRTLAGTRFLGILKLRDTAYIPYYIESDGEWIVPRFEESTYRAQVESIGGIKNIRLILTGNTLEEIWDYLHPQTPEEPLPRGMKRFDRALKELGCEYLMMPYSRDGVVQLSFMRIWRNRELLAAAMGCDTTPREGLAGCDGWRNGNPYIIAIDFNVPRIVRALKQIERADAGLIPRLCCMQFQKRSMFKLLRQYQCRKSVIVSLEKESICRALPGLLPVPILQKPYMTKEGNYIDANKTKIKKTDPEADSILVEDKKKADFTGEAQSQQNPLVEPGI